jgi:preprotein translocase subunit SecG
MVTTLTILALIVSILLILIVLIQKPKGGGITNNLTGGANQIFGVKKTSDIVEKTTWILSGVIGVILLITTGFNGSVAQDGDDLNLDPATEIEKALDNPGAIQQPTQGQFDPNQGGGQQNMSEGIEIQLDEEGNPILPQE